MSSDSDIKDPAHQSCAHCKCAGPQADVEHRPPTHLLLAIFATLVLAPFGILALLSSAKSDTLAAAGDLAGARAASVRSMRWSMAALAIAVAAGLVWITLLVAAIALNDQSVLN